MKNNYLLSLIVSFLILVPISAANALALPWEAEDLPNFIYRSFEFALAVAGLIAFGVLVSAGFRYITSAGDPTKMIDAKDQIKAAFLGLVVLLGSYLILHTLDPHLVKLDPPELTVLPGRIYVHGYYRHPDPKPPERQTRILVGNVPNFGNFRPDLIKIHQPPAGKPEVKLVAWPETRFRGDNRTQKLIAGTKWAREIRFDHAGITSPDFPNQPIPFPAEEPIKITRFSPPAPKSIEIEFFKPFDFALSIYPPRATIHPDPCHAPWCWGQNHVDLRIDTKLLSGESERVNFSYKLPAGLNDNNFNVEWERLDWGFPTYWTQIELASVRAPEGTYEITITATTVRGGGREEIVKETTFYLTIGPEDPVDPEPGWETFYCNGLSWRAGNEDSAERTLEARNVCIAEGYADGKYANLRGWSWGLAPEDLCHGLQFFKDTQRAIGPHAWQIQCQL